jgi:DNA-directed RNA polymerase subunit M/transcription elongation factor TFIIS
MFKTMIVCDYCNSDLIVDQNDAQRGYKTCEVCGYDNWDIQYLINRKLLREKRMVLNRSKTGLRSVV